MVGGKLEEAPLCHTYGFIVLNDDGDPLKTSFI